MRDVICNWSYLNEEGERVVCDAPATRDVRVGDILHRGRVSGGEYYPACDNHGSTKKAKEQK